MLGGDARALRGVGDRGEEAAREARGRGGHPGVVRVGAGGGGFVGDGDGEARRRLERRRKQRDQIAAVVHRGGRRE